MSTSHIRTFRAMLREEKGVILPGAPNALAARIIADLGFKAVYLTGAELTNMHLGLPDLGFMDLSQVADHVMAIRCVIDLPLIVDIDTGFGNAVNVTHTIRILEQAGASAIQIEDQHAPKRCGHFDGKELIPLEEMVGKVRAAVDTRRQELVVIARTDACAVEGFEAAIERAGRYIEAGADVTFVEAPESLEDLKAVPLRLKAPQLVNMVLGGKTPSSTRRRQPKWGLAWCFTPTPRCKEPCMACSRRCRSSSRRGSSMSAPSRHSRSVRGWWTSRLSTSWRPATSRIRRTWSVVRAPLSPRLTKQEHGKDDE